MTGYAEFTNNSNYEQDQVNLQYSQFITRTVFCENRIRQMIHANLDKIENGKEIDHKTVINRFSGWPGQKPIPGVEKRRIPWQISWIWKSQRGGRRRFK